MLVSMLLSIILCLVCVVCFRYVSLDVLIRGSLHFTSLRCVFHHIITVFKACFLYFIVSVVALRCVYIVALRSNLDVVDC
jgi:hypothetical protein